MNDRIQQLGTDTPQRPSRQRLGTCISSAVWLRGTDRESGVDMVDSARPQFGWRPRPGWGTLRNVIRVPDEGDGISVVCMFIFDDASDSQPVKISDDNLGDKIGEYARGIHSGDRLSIKLTPELMRQAEETFAAINAMPNAERAMMFLSGNDLADDAGWSWTSEYRLVKAAAGLIT